MPYEAELIVDTLKKETNSKNYSLLAEKLGLTPSSLSLAKSRGSIGLLLEAAYCYSVQNSVNLLGTLLTSKNNSAITIDDEILFNSIELRIRRMMESKLNHFQHELILMYNAFENLEPKNFDDLIDNLTYYKINLLAEKMQHGISESDRKSTINFLSQLSTPEKNCICQNFEYYRRILWGCIAWFNRFMKKSPD